ncbi:hypothetical protein ACNKHK_18390 [Shigella flexneri]
MAVGEQHNHTVDTDAQTRSRRQTVFQSGNVVFVVNIASSSPASLALT